MATWKEGARLHSGRWTWVGFNRQRWPPHLAANLQYSLRSAPLSTPQRRCFMGNIGEDALLPTCRTVVCY